MENINGKSFSPQNCNLYTKILFKFIPPFEWKSFIWSPAVCFHSIGSIHVIIKVAPCLIELQQQLKLFVLHTMSSIFSRSFDSSFRPLNSMRFILQSLVPESLRRANKTIYGRVSVAGRLKNEVEGRKSFNLQNVSIWCTCKQKETQSLATFLCPVQTDACLTFLIKKISQEIYYASQKKADRHIIFFSFSKTAQQPTESNWQKLLQPHSLISDLRSITIQSGYPKDLIFLPLVVCLVHLQPFFLHTHFFSSCP
mgnify:CR=1 FL=1